MYFEVSFFTIHTCMYIAILSHALNSEIVPGSPLHMHAKKAIEYSAFINIFQVLDEHTESHTEFTHTYMMWVCFSRHDNACSLTVIRQKSRAITHFKKWHQTVTYDATSTSSSTFNAITNRGTIAITPIYLVNTVHCLTGTHSTHTWGKFWLSQKCWGTCTYSTCVQCTCTYIYVISPWNPAVSNLHL